MWLWNWTQNWRTTWWIGIRIDKWSESEMRKLCVMNEAEGRQDTGKRLSISALKELEHLFLCGWLIANWLYPLFNLIRSKLNMNKGRKMNWIKISLFKLIEMRNIINNYSPDFSRNFRIKGYTKKFSISIFILKWSV